MRSNSFESTGKQPKNTPAEQLPLDFDTPETFAEDLDNLSLSELELRFQETTGFDPSLRFLDSARWGDRKELLKRGIRKPAEGKELVTEHDHEEEKIGDAWSKK